MATLRRVPLFSSPITGVTDVSCRDAVKAAGAEECARAHRILFVRQGMFVKHSGREEVVAEPMQALVFNPGATYRVSHPSGLDGEVTVVRYSSSSVLDTLGTLEPQAADRPDAPFHLGHAPLDSATVCRLQRLRMDLLQGAASSLQVDEEALVLLAEVTRFERRLRRLAPALSGEKAARRQTDRIQAVKRLVATHPAAPHTLASLAEAVDWSPFSLTRAFRREVGFPLHQYLLRLRVNLALEQLTIRTDSLSTLALELGFASHSHFGTAFRRFVGVTPSVFRDQVTSRRADRPNLALRI